jgi:hypothetical protein
MLGRLLFPNLLQRCLSSTRSLLVKKMPPRLVIPESDMTEVFVKGSGPGGQKIVSVTLMKPANEVE